MKLTKDSASATALSKMVVCEQQALLEAKGVKPDRLSKEQRKVLHRGDTEHARHHRLAVKHHDSRCFIATAVYGARAVETNALRAFRDDQLSRSAVGRILVALYYRVSPPLARYLDTHPAARRMIRVILNQIVSKIPRSRPWTQ